MIMVAKLCKYTPKKAIELYQRSSDMGNSAAMVNLGLLYKNGTGVAKDMKKAIVDITEKYPFVRMDYYGFRNDWQQKI